ncbi:hypothetical protein GCM10010315_10020 [Streptomyces luteosporeus]|uniref:Transposase n=1 Tax=Streptomyces luteosporeus TaxID=173856 RepID=A0ABN3TLP7_9ACTN
MTAYVRRLSVDGRPLYAKVSLLGMSLVSVLRGTAGNWAQVRAAQAAYQGSPGTLLEREVHLCFTPTNASWANPIETHFGPLRQFTLANSNHPNHAVRTRALHAYLRWRNTNAGHPDVLAAQRRERARIRREKGIRWGEDHSSPRDPAIRRTYAAQY